MSAQKSAGQFTDAASFSHHFDGQKFAQILKKLRRLAWPASANEPAFVLDIKKLFLADKKKERFAKFSRSLDDLLLDFSKTSLTEDIFALLLQLAQAAGLSSYREALFTGACVNITEARPALHSALRLPLGQELFLNDVDIVKNIHDMLSKMAQFSENIRQAKQTGISGAAFSDIVNIGIGGSNLGPEMALAALKPYHDGPNCHYVANLDPAAMADCLKSLNPHSTLFIIASKSFATAETLANGTLARSWLIDKLGPKALARHLVAVTAAPDKARDFGIVLEHIFQFWPWVGGRYSLWSALGLSLMLAIGPLRFNELLKGAYIMDKHFKECDFADNLPVILALIGYWHRLCCHYPTRAIVPYEHHLALLPSYLQQLDMESNGKSTTISGQPSKEPTGPIIWGAVGSNAEHAFFQLLHQGSDIIPVEFIACRSNHEKQFKEQHLALLAHCLAQSQALLWGRDLAASKAQLAASAYSAKEIEFLARHRYFPGNRPSLMLLQDKLTPLALGRLLALYEHRVFVEGVLMNINSFDQWGVELGKELANDILPILLKKSPNKQEDSSSWGLIESICAYHDRIADPEA